jgi:hypothetical protein
MGDTGMLDLRMAVAFEGSSAVYAVVKAVIHGFYAAELFLRFVPANTSWMHAVRLSVKYLVFSSSYFIVKRGLFANRYLQFPRVSCEHPVLHSAS